MQQTGGILRRSGFLWVLQNKHRHAVFYRLNPRANTPHLGLGTLGAGWTAHSSSTAGRGDAAISFSFSVRLRRLMAISRRVARLRSGGGYRRHGVWGVWARKVLAL